MPEGDEVSHPATLDAIEVLRALPQVIAGVNQELTRNDLKGIREIALEEAAKLDGRDVEAERRMVLQHRQEELRRKALANVHRNKKGIELNGYFDYRH